MELADFLEGDLYADLSGSGATRQSFPGNAEGSITVIAGPGKILGRRIDFWAADLIPAMMSPKQDSPSPDPAPLYLPTQIEDIGRHNLRP